MSEQIQTRFIEANGQAFETLVTGNGERVALCLHGFPEHACSWRFQMSHLAQQGFEVWAPNMRGYGRSSRPPRMRDYSIELLMQDVVGLIDAAGGRPVTLLAHDWGAVIAWFFAMRRLRPLERLVIINVPHPAVMARELRNSGRQRRKSWYVLFFQLPFIPELLMGRDNGHVLVRMMRDTVDSLTSARRATSRTVTWLRRAIRRCLCLATGPVPLRHIVPPVMGFAKPQNRPRLGV